MNHPNRIPVIRTDRLTISPMTDEQLAALIDSIADEILKTAYREMLDGCRSHPDDRLWFTAWKMTDRTGTRVGDLGFKGPQAGGSVEIGYGVEPEYEGHGFTTEAVRALTDWALSQPDVNCVTAQTDPDNAASQRVLQKVGFLPAGTGDEGPLFALYRLEDDAASELLSVLRSHAKSYPRMQPTDAVKLIYQNEFGGGHLIKNPAVSLCRLQTEMAELQYDGTIPLYENIGNGIWRLNLAAVRTDAYPPERINDDFVRSSETHQGARERFLAKLSLLLRAFDRIGFSFSKAQLERYLAEYAAADYPPVSHSPEYRDAYRPAYRVIRREN